MGKNIANCPECENIVEKSCEEEITNHEMEFLQEFSHEERDEELEISALTQELRSNKRIYKKILNEED